MTPTYNQLRNAPRLDLGQSFPLRAPLALYVEPTNVCNFRCVLCPESFPDYQEQAGYYGRMPLELFQKVVRDLQELGGVRSLKLYFEGEPLLNPDLHLMIKMAKDGGAADRVEVTSNGSMLTERRAIELIEAGLDYLQVSIYSVDETAHAEITGTKVSPSLIRENMQRVKRIRDERGATTPFIYAKLMHDSTEGEARFREVYSGVADEIGVQYRHNWNGMVGIEMLTRSYTPNAAGASNEFKFKKDACPFPFYLMAVKANGQVSACCVDWNGGVNIGDLNRETLSEIWNGEKLRTLQRLHVSGKRNQVPACANCDALYTTPDFVHLTAQEFEERLAGSAVGCTA
jgi:radical SAM protein with 4Fe4S-binding SPASM domain